MQYNFPSYVRLSSKVSFTASIDELTNNTSENHIILFPNFSFVNCLLMLYSVQCNSCVLRNNNGTYYCNCSLVPKTFFWLVQSRRNWNVLRCIYAFYLMLKYCSDINEGNWLQLLFYFVVLMNIVASFLGLIFPKSVGQVLG